MRHFSAWVFYCCLTLAALAGRAQAPAYGDWQLHLPARHPLQLAEAGDRLYVLDEASFYYYDKTLHATRFLSRRDGLSDVGVKALAYDPASAQLLIAYANGNLDLLAADGSVRNITDLLRKQTQGNKEVNQVQVFDGLAYVSTNLGVVVVDLAKHEVRDTYGAIGPGGSNVTAYATAVLHDTLWASTSAGILRGYLRPAVNLLDYHNWTKELADPQTPGRVFPYLAPYQGHLVASTDYYGVGYVTGVGMARRWQQVPNSYAIGARRLHVSGGQLLVMFDSAPLRRFDAATGQLVDVLPAASVGNSARDAVRADDGTLYVASFELGLLRFAGGLPPAEAIQPDSPESTKNFALTADAATNTVDVFTGGYATDGLQFGYKAGFYEYSAGRWTNYTAITYPSTRDFPNLLDLSHGARLPGGKLYIASYGNGLLEWQGPGQFQQYTYGTGSSPLRSSLDPDTRYLDYVRVSDVAADPNGKYLWLVNRHQRNTLSGLYRFRPATGDWLTATWLPGFENLDRVVVDGFSNPWATRKGGLGVVAYDTLSQRSFTFTQASTTVAGSSTSGLPSNMVNALARDRKGAIWFGTSQGVAYVADPSSLLNGDQPMFQQPVSQSGNGLFPTLYSETVRCIAVDGGNRKWFGTTNGLWLFSENADKALLHFTTANSPLPSNGIVDVAVNDKTGEVFVATDLGLVSYQGAASLTEGSPSCAEVFPNPVRPEFAGTVGIRGVANNAQVKITDVAGHLVYSTTAAGGTVTWNLTDTAGRRVRSGVYLVLSADAEGNNTCVSKVAVLSN